MVVKFLVSFVPESRKVKKLSILQLGVLLFVGCLSAAYSDVTSKCSAVEGSLQPMWLAGFDANPHIS